MLASEALHSRNVAFYSWQPQKNDSDVTVSENGKGYKEAAQNGLVGELKNEDSSRLHRNLKAETRTTVVMQKNLIHQSKTPSHEQH
jgi:hypothetical protein